MRMKSLRRSPLPPRLNAMTQLCDCNKTYFPGFRFLASILQCRGSSYPRGAMGRRG